MGDLATEIAAGHIAPVYVLTSEEPLLVQRTVVALRDATVPPASRAFNLDVCDAKLGATAILNAARTLPMMGARRLVLVKDAETLGAEGLDAVRAYLDAPSPTTVLVLVCGKVDGRLKFFAAAKKKGVLHELVVPRQIVAWVQAEARQVGVRLAADAAARLAEVVGRDLSRLASALLQLGLYVGEGEAVTAADVDELIAETRQRTVFELANAVASGERTNALVAVARLFAQRESAVGVAMMLARHYRQLAVTRELTEAMTPASELPRLVGVPPFALDGLIRQARRLSVAAIPRVFALLARADRDLKSSAKGALGERMIVERLALALAALSGEPASRRGG